MVISRATAPHNVPLFGMEFVCFFQPSEESEPRPDNGNFRRAWRSEATDRVKRETVSALPFAKAVEPEHLIPLQNEHRMHATASKSMRVVG